LIDNGLIIIMVHRTHIIAGLFTWILTLSSIRISFHLYLSVNRLMLL